MKVYGKVHPEMIKNLSKELIKNDKGDIVWPIVFEEIRKSKINDNSTLENFPIESLNRLYKKLIEIK